MKIYQQLAVAHGRGLLVNGKKIASRPTLGPIEADLPPEIAAAAK